MTLAEASRRQARPRSAASSSSAPDDHVLEIGTGWGGFALHAAGRYGCRVTTTTISREQHELARERVRAAGLEDRVTVLLEDYRDLAGRYDKLVSIEMIEAVGHQHFEEFFRRCGGAARARRADAPAGDHHRRPALRARARRGRLHQALHLPGQLHPVGRRAVAGDGGASDLRLVHLEDIGPHYATTLRAGARTSSRDCREVRALGYPEEFLRMWEFYLCYCEAGFAERALGDVQLLLRRGA